MKNFETTVTVEDVSGSDYVFSVICGIDPEDCSVLRIVDLDVESVTDWRLGTVGMDVDLTELSQSDRKRLALLAWNCFRKGEPLVRGEDVVPDEWMRAWQRESALASIRDAYMKENDIPYLV